MPFFNYYFKNFMECYREAHFLKKRIYGVGHGYKKHSAVKADPNVSW